MLLKTLSYAAICVGLFFSAEIKHLYYYKTLTPNVFHVEETRGTATAFKIRYKNRTFFITNNHVCQISADKKFLNIGKSVVAIKRIALSHDLCALELQGETGGFELAEEYSIGDQVICIGYPMDYGKTMARGHIIDMKTETFDWIGKVQFMEVSCPGISGVSGSPVLNLYGKVVGVVFAGNPEFTNASIAVPLRDLKRFLDIL